MCRFGTDAFKVDADVESDKGVVNCVRVAYVADTERKYFLDNNEVRRSSDVIGMFPIVVLSPGDFALTTGAPSERRKFVDMVLSQVSRSYLEELMEYRRVLKQRNKLLLDGKLTSAIDSNLLSAWTDALIEHGTKVMRKREEFVDDFQSTFTAAYASLVEYGEAPRLKYEPSFPLNRNSSTRISTFELFHDVLSRLAKAEQVRGSSLAGPHRDDIGFLLNDVPIREFASQGQHKTFLVALKIAEFHYMTEKLNETPAMLLDDVMTELDYARASKTIHAVSDLGQTFITATDMLNFDEKLLDARATKIHVVKEGSVVYENA